MRKQKLGSTGKVRFQEDLIGKYCRWNKINKKSQELRFPNDDTFVCEAVAYKFYGTGCPIRNTEILLNKFCEQLALVLADDLTAFAVVPHVVAERIAYAAAGIGFAIRCADAVGVIVVETPVRIARIYRLYRIFAGRITGVCRVT